MPVSIIRLKSYKNISLGIALEAGVELVWLLDDDNVPQEGCLEALQEKYKHRRQHVQANQLAV